MTWAHLWPAYAIKDPLYVYVSRSMCVSKAERGFLMNKDGLPDRMKGRGAQKRDYEILKNASLFLMLAA